MTSTIAAPWERNRPVARLTAAIVELKRKTAKMLVDAAVSLGGMLEDVKQRLPHGEWNRWLATGVHIDQRTAERYMAMYRWKRASPREFAKVHDLDISKVYRVMPLSPELRRRLYDRAIPIPDTPVRLTLREMTVAQLNDVIRGFGTTPAREDPVPKLLQGARHRVASLRAHTDELIEHAADVDPDAIAELHAELLEVAERLEGAFGL